MNDLDVWAAHSMWDNERSRGAYRIPLGLTESVAAVQGAELAVGIPEQDLYRMAKYWCTTSPESHRAAYKHAIDFLVLDGSSVYAAAPGLVVEVQVQSNTWGPDARFRDSLNYLTIQHGAGEYSQYCHLAPYSAHAVGVRVGLQVGAGQRIAVVGKTGWTDRDHLHFIVFRGFSNPSPFQFKSLVPHFVTE